MTKKVFALLMLSVFVLTAYAQEDADEWMMVNLQSGQETEVSVSDDCTDECELPALLPIEEEMENIDIEEEIRFIDFDIEDTLYDEQNLVPTRIVGEDSREDITERAQGVAKAAVVLAIAFPVKGSGFCSGVMVGPRLVLTAAHCLFSPERKGEEAKKVLVVANGVKGKPRAAALDRWIPKRFVVKKGKNRFIVDGRHDVALLVLDKPLGNITGIAGLKVLPEGQYDNLPVTAFGRGADKDWHSLWKSVGKVGIVHDEFLFTNLPVLAGNSGSPAINSSEQVIGLFTSDQHPLTIQGILRYPIPALGVMVKLRDKWRGIDDYPNIILKLRPSLINVIQEANRMVNQWEQRTASQSQLSDKKKKQNKTRSI